MSIPVTCDGCGKRVNAPDRLAGKRAKCKCGSIIDIPSPGVPAGGGLDELAAFEARVESVAAGVGISQAACPSCGQPLTSGAVLCVACGFDLRRGTRAATAMETAPDDAPSAKPAKTTRTPNLNSPGSGTTGRLVKYVIVLACLGGLGFGAYQLKESLTFDPEKQRDEDHAKIYPGMTVEQVVEAMGRKPKEAFTEREPTADKLVQNLPRRLAYVDNFVQHYDARDLRYGFWFIYRYSERSQLVIYFSSDGKVDSAIKNDPLKMIGL